MENIINKMFNPPHNPKQTPTQIQPNPTHPPLLPNSQPPYFNILIPILSHIDGIPKIKLMIIIFILKNVYIIIVK